MVIRRSIWLLPVAAILVIPTSTWSRQTSQTQGQPGQSSPTQASQTDSLADAARRAKEQKKEEPKSAKVFTNEDLPTNATISVVGTATVSPATTGKPAGTAPANAATSSDEKMWRDRFARLNHKLEQDQSELAVLQRELAVLNVQYYGGDPMKGLQQGMSQADITAKRDKIDAKTKDVADDQQAISDAEADLQKAGGDPGWER